MIEKKPAIDSDNIKAYILRIHSDLSYNIVLSERTEVFHYCFYSILSCLRKRISNKELHANTISIYIYIIYLLGTSRWGRNKRTNGPSRILYYIIVRVRAKIVDFEKDTFRRVPAWKRNILLHNVIHVYAIYRRRSRRKSEFPLAACFTHIEEWYTTNYWNTDTSRVRFNIYINMHMRIYAHTYVTCVYIKAERSYMYILCYWQRVEQYYRILYISVLYRIPCTN